MLRGHSPPPLAIHISIEGEERVADSLSITLIRRARLAIDFDSMKRINRETAKQYVRTGILRL